MNYLLLGFDIAYRIMRHTSGRPFTLVSGLYDIYPKTIFSLFPVPLSLQESSKRMSNLYKKNFPKSMTNLFSWINFS